jgi:hypothetical protein
MNKSQIRRIDQDIYFINCAECSEKAVSFGERDDFSFSLYKAFTGHNDDPCYIYKGITGSQGIFGVHIEKVKMLLAHNTIKELNEYLVHNCGFSEGMDAYCYECNCVYCYKHFDIQVIFADDFPEFYDCTMGTCPKKHRRKIDD